MRVALVLITFVAAGAAIGWTTLSGGENPTYTARFSSARGLVAGNDVRVGGAVAGRVREVRLAHDGSAEVVFTTTRRAAPRADARAAIRPVDLLGDTYLALSPGADRAALQGPIDVTRTVNAPRLDELLRTFSPPVRDALGALIVETGLALDERGADLAATAVQLKPALTAADRVVGELDGQNHALAALVPDAERAASQLGSRADDLGPLIDSLARTLDTTAAHGSQLDATVAGLPATLTRVRRTATTLGATARAAQPVARTLRDSAPQLQAALTELRPFVARLRTTATVLRPAVRSLRRTLAGGAQSLPKLDRALRALLTATPDIQQLVAAIEPAAPGIAKGFLENFPDQAAEPGNQPLDPFADPRRRYWRGAAVMSCEAFGVPVKPGCLNDVLSGLGLDRRGTSATPAPAKSPLKLPAAKPAPATSAAATTSKPPVVAALEQLTTKATNGAGGLLDFLLGKP